jgi:hypothetical protein
MKPVQLIRALKTSHLSILMMAALLSLSMVSHGQIPDCSSGTVMYGIWNDSIRSTSAVNPNSEIRPVNYATGAIGGLMGGIKFGISKVLNGVTYRGSAGLGVDIITNRFYVMTQMGSGSTSDGTNPSGQKDIYTINTVTNTMVRIGTTASSLNNYHFVKVAISPTGVGYAIGVHRDSTAASATFNPLIRFTTCGGAPVAGCSVITLLGYLPTSPVGVIDKWRLFNGDIAFDQTGNLYFAAAAFGMAGTINRYTDARLFRINAANIPTVAGTGIIPMSLVADYDLLDSTVVNGIALDPSGDMYLATRRFNGIQTSPAGPFTNQIYVSNVPGGAMLLNSFARVSAGYSIADLASCYFPITILPEDELELSARQLPGSTTLSWKANNCDKIVYFEVQRSDGDPDHFETIGKVYPRQDQEFSQSFEYSDQQKINGDKSFYRIRKVTSVGMNLYSNVVRITFRNILQLTATPRPNPVINDLQLNVELKTGGTVNVRVIDGTGRTAHQQQFKVIGGNNILMVNNLSKLKAGIYFLEISSGTEVVREKIVKQ